MVQPEGLHYEPVDHRFKDDSGTNAVAAACGASAAAGGCSGSRRATRARSWPCSYRSSQYDSVSRSRRRDTRRALKRAAAAVARAAPLSSQRKVTKIGTLSNGLQQCQPPDTIPAGFCRFLRKPMTHKPKTVLIVDDDEGMRDTLTAILKREYRVLRASSGEAALPILNREDVDLMLLDVRLPGISGFAVLRIGKENYRLTQVIISRAAPEVAAR